MSKDAIVGDWQDLIRQAASSKSAGESNATPAQPSVLSPRVFPVGARTKSRLAEVACSTTIEVKELSGIVAYDPSEYLITAQAGTTLVELIEALAENGQHLPFDPLFVSSGSTLGGTVASGISGPGQMLYGSLRDFVMEVEFIDGLGNLVRGGGKVVKNAAGFDFPKLLVGSLGRLGILTELTLKVLPSPRVTQSLRSRFATIGEALSAWSRLRRESIPIRMLNLQTDGLVRVEVAGLAEALPDVISRIHHVVPREWEATATRPLQPSDLDPQLSQCDILVRVATQPALLESLLDSLRSLPGFCSFEAHAGGSVLWLGMASSTSLLDVSRTLEAGSSSGMVVASPPEVPVFIGDCRWQSMATRIQNSIDPHGVFAAF